MKRLHPFLVFILLTCLALPFGCKKDEESKPNNTVNLAGTTSKKWKLTAATVTYGGQNINIFDTGNGLYSLPICKQDDIFTFFADHKYETSEGATSCTPATTDKGSWAFNSDETQLTLTSTGTSFLPYSGIPLTVNFSGNTMQGQANNVPFNIPGFSITASANFTFTAQ